MAQFDWKFAWHLLTAIVAIALATSYLLRTSNNNNNKPAGRSQQSTNLHGLRPPNPEVPLPASASHLHIYDKAAVCADSNACSNIGSNILQQNGSAVDAAIATLLCNGLITMQSMGIGGGFLMNIYKHDEQQAFSLLSREAAPLASEDGMLTQLQNRSEFFLSGLAVGVPGELMGYYVAHARFGQLPWAALVQPTIRICQNGFRLSKHQRDALFTNKESIMHDVNLRKMFVDATTGEFHRVDKFIRPPSALCQTYATLAGEGPLSFYNGSLSKLLLQDLQELNSTIVAKDLLSYKAKLLPALTIPLGCYKLHLTPPPGSGYVLGFVMNILQSFAVDFQGALDIEKIEMQRIVEALKYAFVKRWELDVDADEQLLANLTSANYAQRIAKKISLTNTYKDITHYGTKGGLKSRNEHGTAHISVLAPNGDAVSVTSSINYYFGIGRTGRRTGIIFNNALTDFNIAGIRNYFQLPHRSDSNQLKPGHSPMSSMSPLIVTDAGGNVRLVVGAAGGTKIISVLAQILVRTLWLKQNIKQAIDAPRFHHQLLPNILEYEFGILQELVDAMEARGHKTRRYRERGTAVCGLEKLDGVVYGNADYRKDGGVSGF